MDWLNKLIPDDQDRVFFMLLVVLFGFLPAVVAVCVTAVEIIKVVYGVQ